MELHIDTISQMIKSQVPLPYVLAYFGVSFNEMQTFLGTDLVNFYEQTKKAGIAELMVRRFELALKKGNPLLIQSLIEQYVNPLSKEEEQKELTFKIEIVRNDTHNTSN